MESDVPRRFAAQIEPYLTLERQKGIIAGLRGFPRKIQYYIDAHHGELLQGDGRAQLEILRFQDGARKAVRGIVLSNSCDISVENQRSVPMNLTFAPLTNVSAYCDLLARAGWDERKIEAWLTDLKSQEITQLFYLPKGAMLEEDVVARLDDVRSIPMSAVDSSAKTKIFTLSDVGFYLFLFKLSIHFCRFHEGVDRQGVAEHPTGTIQ
ncbi:MAG: hypothetical protein E6Q40_01530 [Cupriavidus sp.]|nr:MAG: hypothetical protein E6Q40_01530 [Cupriavidus sp.]